MEGVGNNKRKDNMTEITEIGEVIWESNANRAIIDIEQKTKSQTIKELIETLTQKKQVKNQANLVIRSTKLKYVYDLGPIRKNY